MAANLKIFDEITGDEGDRTFNTSTTHSPLDPEVKTGQTVAELLRACAIYIMFFVYIASLILNTGLLLTSPFAGKRMFSTRFRLAVNLVLADMYCTTNCFFYFFIYYTNLKDLFTTTLDQKVCVWSLMDLQLHFSAIILMVQSGLLLFQACNGLCIPKFKHWSEYHVMMIFLAFFPQTYLLCHQMFSENPVCPKHPYSTVHDACVIIMTMSVFVVYKSIKMLKNIFTVVSSEKAYCEARQDALEKFISETDPIEIRKRISHQISHFEATYYIAATHLTGIAPGIAVLFTVCEGCQIDTEKLDQSNAFMIYYFCTMFVLLKSAFMPFLYYRKMPEMKMSVDCCCKVMNNLLDKWPCEWNSILNTLNEMPVHMNGEKRMKLVAKSEREEFGPKRTSWPNFVPSAHPLEIDITPRPLTDDEGEENDPGSYHIDLTA